MVDIDGCNHLPKWEAAKEMNIGLKKQMRNATEAALATTGEATHHREGFIRRVDNAPRVPHGSDMRGL